MAHHASFLAPTSKRLPEEVLDNVDGEHPDQVYLECPAGGVMIFNAHTWHGGTINYAGTRRRVLHGLYIDREDVPQQDQKKWLTKDTASRLTHTEVVVRC